MSALEPAQRMAGSASVAGAAEARSAPGGLRVTSLSARGLGRDHNQDAVLVATPVLAATLIAAIVQRGRVTIAHVGDSRAYLWNPAGLRRLTADHRRVEELLRLGAVDRAALRAHPQRHLITRAIGMAPVVCPDVTEVPTARGDVLLLCSDGISDVLEDYTIAAACAAWREPDDLARDLLGAARAAGGRD